MHPSSANIDNGGPAVGTVEVVGFDQVLSKTCRAFIANVLGDVSLTLIDGSIEVYTVTLTGVQPKQLIQINSVGTVGAVTDYIGLC